MTKKLAELIGENADLIAQKITGIGMQINSFMNTLPENDDIKMYWKIFKGILQTFAEERE